MSVDCLKKFSLEDVRGARIDFTSSGTVVFGGCGPELLGTRCTVLQPDKNRFGDKSTTGSPISSHRGSSVHHDSSGSSSSGSPIASPISYTRDLIGIDSPGLSGGAGAITPVKKEQASPMVPVATPKELEARSVMLTAEPAPQPPPVPPRKSRFDVKPEDMEVDEKPKVEQSLLPNGKRKAQSDSDDDVDPRRAGVGLFLKKIKLETQPTTVTKQVDLKTLLASVPVAPRSPSPPAEDKPKSRLPLLVPRAVATAAAAPVSRVNPPKTPSKLATTAASPISRANPPITPCKRSISLLEEEEESTADTDDETDLGPILGPIHGHLVGPQLPTKTNGIANSPLVNGSKLPISREDSVVRPEPSTKPVAAAVSAATTGITSSVAKSARKRLLSERGEKELKYPVMEKEISSKWGWEGATWLGERKRGVGLINRANDCFLNVILQMITHTAPLSRYLVERHKADCKRETHACVACALRQHHLERTFRQNGPMETRWIGPHLKRIFPSHSFGMQEDAHELLSLLLDAIDPPPGWNRENGNKELPTNKLKPSTPIEQIFGGTLRNQVTCQACHTPFINYERIRELNVALGKKQEDRIPLISLVQDYFKNETITAFSCKKCSRKTQAVRQTRVLRAPAVLIVQLKRFNAYGGKIRQPIHAEKELDLTKFTYDGVMGEAEGGGGVGKKASYVLTGVVEHLGSTVDHGHYIAYCRSIDNQTWFKFDDEEVTKLNTYSNNPYLLFYSRKDLQPKSKNGHSNGVASSTPSTSKLATNNVMRPLTNGPVSGQNGHANGVRPMANGGGYVKPYQNGGNTQPKTYNNHNGNGYGNGNKSNNNGYGGKYNNHQQSYNKWSNAGGGRQIKTFKFQWNSHQRI